MSPTLEAIAFAGKRCIASGPLAEVVSKAKRALEKNPRESVLVFDDATGDTIEVDFRGTPKDVSARLAAPGPAPAEETRGPGRPKLGVVAREVTLLPRHWEWLNGQPGGASVALRKLVEDARRANAKGDRLRRSQEGAYRFMSAMAGNLTNFEEATRALFAGQRDRFVMLTEPWPEGIRDHARKLAGRAFLNEKTPSSLGLKVPRPQTD